MTSLDLASLDAQQLRELIAQRDREIAFKQALIDKMTHEMAVLKRLKFDAFMSRRDRCALTTREQWGRLLQAVAASESRGTP